MSRTAHPTLKKLQKNSFPHSFPNPSFFLKNWGENCKLNSWIWYFTLIKHAYQHTSKCVKYIIFYLGKIPKCNDLYIDKRSKYHKIQKKSFLGPICPRGQKVFHLIGDFWEIMGKWWPNDQGYLDPFLVLFYTPL